MRYIEGFIAGTIIGYLVTKYVGWSSVFNWVQNIIQFTLTNIQDLIHYIN